MTSIQNGSYFWLKIHSRSSLIRTSLIRILVYPNPQIRWWISLHVCESHYAVMNIINVYKGSDKLGSTVPSPYIYYRWTMWPQSNLVCSHDPISLYTFHTAHNHSHSLTQSLTQSQSPSSLYFTLPHTHTHTDHTHTHTEQMHTHTHTTHTHTHTHTHQWCHYQAEMKPIIPSKLVHSWTIGGEPELISVLHTDCSVAA